MFDESFEKEELGLAAGDTGEIDGLNASATLTQITVVTAATAGSIAFSGKPRKGGTYEALQDNGADYSMDVTASPRTFIIEKRALSALKGVPTGLDAGWSWYVSQGFIGK